MNKNTPPLVSFILVAYNQEKFIEEAILGALSQTYKNIEIILSDDGSSDRTFDIIQKVSAKYDGPHKVILNRNAKNMGLVPHINHVCNLCTGDIIILAAGDDISFPSRAARSVELLNDETVAISFSSNVFTDKSEIRDFRLKQEKPFKISTHDWSEYLINPFFHLNGAARSFRREVFTTFGPISPNCPTEDSVLLLRALLYGKVKSSNETLIHYRKHDDNISSESGLLRMNFAKLYEQFSNDIQSAKLDKLISENNSILLKTIFRNRIDETIIINNYKSSKFSIRLFLRVVLYKIKKKIRVFHSS